MLPVTTSIPAEQESGSPYVKNAWHGSPARYQARLETVSPTAREWNTTEHNTVVDKWGHMICQTTWREATVITRYHLTLPPPCPGRLRRFRKWTTNYFTSTITLWDNAYLYLSGASQCTFLCMELHLDTMQFVSRLSLYGHPPHVLTRFIKAAITNGTENHHNLVFDVLLRRRCVIYNDMNSIDGSYSSIKMVYELRRQPFRGIYITIQLLQTYLIRMPIWALLSLPKFLRPRPSWSVFKTFITNYARVWSDIGPIAARVGPSEKWPDYRAIPDTPGIKSIWLEPTPQLLIGDVARWAEEADVRPTRIPGYWYDKEGTDTPVGAPPEAGEKVILYLHGGCFIAQSAHPDNMMGHCLREVLRHSPAKRGFAVEHRLVGLAPYTNPFPAALLDNLAGYHYLVDIVGYAPDNIIFLGDSAGGAHVLALARYIVDNITELSTLMRLPQTPPSNSMILLSPWCDLGTSHETPGSSALTFTFDFLPDLRSGLMRAARLGYAHAFPPGAAETNPYISPASRHPDCHASFKGFPRTFIDVGGAERFRDMGYTLADKMRKDLGAENVVFREGTDAVHCYIHSPLETEEAAKMLKAVEAFLE
ncbi:predicted protein [Postia placenta Mad-698-R]|nr:predicted protein [Postia placenta Mad-698-R]